MASETVFLTDGGPRAALQTALWRAEYIHVPRVSLLEARVCSDARIRGTILNMLERL